MKLAIPRAWREYWIALLLVALTVLSRIPFRSQILYHWDSVNFAYAMREFDVAREQPQPPGYIVYVWLCRGVDLLFGDPQTTMVWISVAASGLAVLALYDLGRAMFDARTGLLAALFLATSPLFWFYGEVALPHALDMLFTIVGVRLLYGTMRGDTRYLYPAIIVMAVAGGVRQQTLVFLIPLILYALRKVGWKRLVTASVLGAVICLLWFVPLMAVSGGVQAYLQVTGQYAARYNATTSVFAGGGWWGVQRNLIKLVLYTLYGWGVPILPLGIYLLSRLRHKAWPRHWEKPLFLACWLLPALVFYTLVHMGQPGLTFLFLPLLLLLSAKGSVSILPEAHRRWLAPAAALLVLVNSAIFGLLPEYPLPTDRVRFLNLDTLNTNDRYYQDRIAFIQATFAPEATAILASNWHHVEYYLPAYRLLPMTIVAKWELGEGQTAGAPQQFLKMQDLGVLPGDRPQAYVVVFDETLFAFNDTPELAQVIPLPYGSSMAVFALPSDAVFYFGPSFGIQAP